MSFYEIISKAWAQLGAIGLLIGVLLYNTNRMNIYINKKDDIHRKERDTWREEARRQTDAWMTVVKENTSAISQMCTLIKSKRE